MTNPQLVEYIKQQMTAGVSKDAVRQALADAGWAAGDIDDSLKAAEPAAPITATNMAAGPATAGSTAAATSSQPTINPVVAMGGMDAFLGKSDAAKSASSDKFFAKKPIVDEDEEHPSIKKFVIALIAMGVLVLLLGGALAFVYFNLNGQLSAAQQAGSGSNGQLATLQNTISGLQQENQTLKDQAQASLADEQQLAAEIAFFSYSTSAASSSAVQASAKGTLTGNGSAPYVLTTPHGLRVYVANYKDAKVQAALTPLANGTTTVILAGTHAVASPNLTVSSVNGAAL